MKSTKTLTADIARKLTNRWHLVLAGQDTEAFPHAFPLGKPTAAQLRTGYAAVHAWTVELQGWARRHDVALVYDTRVATGGTRQSVPTHVRIDDIDQAAAVVGGPWPQRLERGRNRLGELTQSYPVLDEASRLVRMADSYSDLDFELLRRVADWYLAAPARTHGVTPRQVPVPGVHAKWLQSHLPAVQLLIGLDLDLLPAHPARIHFTYLDPDHRAAGGRIHDSATVGDSFAPSYLPEVVVISENKDTAIHFPPLQGAISVEGAGRGGRTLAAFPWLRDAPVVVYWGDMDADGYEILAGYRTDFGRDLDSILMNRGAYEEFERFGTDLDRFGRTLGPRPPRSTGTLRPDEASVYERLCDLAHTGHRRVEQERIPLDRALAEVSALC